MSKVKFSGNIEIELDKFKVDKNDVESIFIPEVCEVIQILHTKFKNRRDQLLASRKRRQSHYDQGKYPEYPPKDSEISTSNWVVGSIPNNLLKRKVEICVPTNSLEIMKKNYVEDWGASSVVFDLEDSMVSRVDTMIQAHKNIVDITKNMPEIFSTDTPTPMVRVRNLHSCDSFSKIEDSPISKSIIDIALFTVHYAKQSLANGLNPCIYIPKVEDGLESLWWNDVISEAEKTQGLAEGTIKVTYLIETLNAAYNCEEILYHSRKRTIGLNVGKWDRLFSDIKVFRNRAERIFPDRDSISMGQFWMDNYARRVIKIAHERGALAIGGLSTLIPDVSESFLEVQKRNYEEEKRHEYNIGHDGTWVSHHYFGKIALDIFKKENQIENKLTYFAKYPDLIASPVGPKTLDCVKSSLKRCLKYISSYLQGMGTILINNSIEDLSSFEISRAQLWQWNKHEILLDSTETVTPLLIENMLSQEYEAIHRELQANFIDSKILEGQEEYLRKSRDLLRELILSNELDAYFTDYIARNQE
jgi:malate synthase